MKRSRFSDEQIIGFLKQVESGVAVKDLGRKQGFSDVAFYKWRTRFGGMDASDARRLRELEGENGKLKKPLAEARVLIGAWRLDYNQSRPHSALEYGMPPEFAAAFRARHAGPGRREARS